MRWMRFNKYLYRYWKLQALVIGLGLVAVPVSLVNPYLTKLVIDKAYGNKDLKLFFSLAAIGAAVFIINGMINSLSQYLSKKINRNVKFDITSDMFRHLQSLSLGFFGKRSTGEYIYRMSSDLRSVTDFVCNIIPQMITLVPRLIFIIAIVFKLNIRLAVLAILLVPITYIHPYVFGKWLRDLTRRNISRAQGIFKELQEVFSHIHLVKALGKESREIDNFENKLRKRVDVELENVKINQVSSFSSAILGKIVSGLMVLYGGYQVIQGTITLGSLTAVMIYLTQLIGSLKSMGTMYQNITINSVVRQRVAELFDVKPEIVDSHKACEFSFEQGEIELRNVSFGYKKDISVLEDLSFRIPGGEKIGLIGLSGSGKTTIISLILRLYNMWNGNILIDGKDIRDIKLKSLKSQIGVALQEPFLWNDTIANNIAYGYDGFSREDIERAAKLANAHDFISALPKGYASIAGEMANTLSEGQKQRIAVARALIGKPKILLFDEAMASVDSQSEEKIIDNICSDSPDTTLVMISHRLSAVQKMDKIYFLEGKSKISCGTHEQLVKNNLEYRKLFAHQIQANI